MHALAWCSSCWRDPSLESTISASGSFWSSGICAFNRATASSAVRPSRATSRRACAAAAAAQQCVGGGRFTPERTPQDCSSAHLGPGSDVHEDAWPRPAVQPRLEQERHVHDHQPPARHTSARSAHDWPQQALPLGGLAIAVTIRCPHLHMSQCHSICLTSSTPMGRCVAALSRLRSALSLNTRRASLALSISPAQPVVHACCDS